MPVLKLLRTAHGFFSSAQPLNEAAFRLPAPEWAPRSDFEALLDGLQSKIEGEEHRVGTKGGWIGLNVALAGMMVAAFAIQDARRTEAEREPISHKSNAAPAAAPNPAQAAPASEQKLVTIDPAEQKLRSSEPTAAVGEAAR